MSPPTYKRLDKDNCLFLFVDHQTALCGLVRDFEPVEFLNNVKALVRLCTFFKCPAILTTSFDTGPNGPMIKGVRDALPDAPLVRRPGQINAMDNEEFADLIKKSGKRQIIISGVLTEVCVTFPALALIEQGYDLFAITDASGTFAEHTREATHKRLVQHGVQLLNWVAAAGELQRDWRNDVEGFGALWDEFVPSYSYVLQGRPSEK
ncbi:Isochorismatase-like protein [Emericellopsis atlantica]|uniref:Isochorismatase-like protein n=1 Tax=Emericellopsis atlantica TaxID=2614577 RepID=A0A9P8CMF1_9HYPO|nr:Isochorismatase-like protein [Emericellopsis atlantica]KAG9252042.1 Isochorismatase-like protein [Emericellopsis atlantica]